MNRSSHRIQRLAEAFAHTIPTVDETANHSRWKPGIGPFEEEKQIEMIRKEVEEQAPVEQTILYEKPYPDSGRRVDLFLADDGDPLPIEAKLIRFRRDNGNIDPNMYKSIFSPFPERSSSSMLTDCQKLAESGFDFPCGVLGLYYERNEEEYADLRPDRIAEKFTNDVSTGTTSQSKLFASNHSVASATLIISTGRSSAGSSQNHDTGNRPR